VAPGDDPYIHPQRGWAMWLRKRRWYERTHRPLNRLRIDRHAARGGFYVRHPIEGEVLEALADGRLTIGEGAHLEPGCWFTMGPEAKISIGRGTYLNRETMTRQGFTSKGPVRIGSSVWLGKGVVVTSGVTIGDRAVIGANSVVTRDIPAATIAAGVPAKPIRENEFRDSAES
jgi:acetyltransferase-like isoleucine patch superfamily enzyme